MCLNVEQQRIFIIVSMLSKIENALHHRVGKYTLDLSLYGGQGVEALFNQTNGQVFSECGTNLQKYVTIKFAID